MASTEAPAAIVGEDGVALSKSEQKRRAKAAQKAAEKAAKAAARPAPAASAGAKSTAAAEDALSPHVRLYVTISRLTPAFAGVSGHAYCRRRGGARTRL